MLLLLQLLLLLSIMMRRRNSEDNDGESSENRCHCPPLPPIEICGEECTKYNYSDGPRICCGCSSINCEKPVCESTFVPEGKCCEVCRPDCSDVQCVEPPCEERNRFTPEGECCQSCKQDCSYVDCTEPPCKRKKRFIPQGECCQTCKEDCTNVTCPIPYCNNTYVPEVLCCEQCREDCSKARCPELKCKVTYTPRGKCCKKCRKDRICRRRTETETIICDGSASSLCPDGTSCTAPPSDEAIADGSGVCCKDARNSCYYKGVIYQHREEFWDESNKCKCRRGNVTCEEKESGGCSSINCEKPVCESTFVPEGKCCEVCRPDCSDVQCVEPPCEERNRFTPEGECCQSCKQDCSYVDCTEPPCKRKKRFIPQGECCQTCKEDCTNVTCPIPYCNNTYVPEVLCCEQCREDCSKARCPELKCKVTYTSRGKCCKKCRKDRICRRRTETETIICDGSASSLCPDGTSCTAPPSDEAIADGSGVCCKDARNSCYYKGVIYQHREEFWDESNKCKCRRGNVTCEEKESEITP